MRDGIYPVTVPKWGIEMQEGTVVQWHVAEGKELNQGDELIDVETDKIVNTMEAPIRGILRRCVAQAGETLKVGSLLGVMASAELDDAVIDAFIREFRSATAAAADDQQDSSAPTRPTLPQAPLPSAAENAGEASSQRVRVSPAAARRAKELGIDINKVTPSGRRISPEDVERFAQQSASSDLASESNSDYESIPLSPTRKSIARRLVEAKQQIPHFYLSMDVNMEAALARREEMNRRGTQKISVNDIVMRSVVLALLSVPDVNIHLVQEEIRRFRHVNLAMAVATGRGIITPVIQRAETLSLAELAQCAATLGEKARAASLAREDLEGGTFTVSNLGMYGISEFQAIINPPQGAILALGACEERIVPGAEKAEKARLMRLTLSCDHRAIDGALGASFLSDLKTKLESPTQL
jgi:pyruvate dehydrogenase E2 component (dihydrolipoamide acetyltransferase)